MFLLKSKMPYEKEVKKIRRLLPSIEVKSQEELIDYIEQIKNETIEPIIEKFGKGNLKKVEDRKLKIFAVGIEVIKRTLEMSLFDVQIAGALALTDKNIVEMKTGEGKTVTAILSAFWGHVENIQTYIITVNEYLSNRDYLQCKTVFDYLGMGVGHINKEMFLPLKQENYRQKVVYITNTEFAFDYLRDNVAPSKEVLMQSDYDFMIIDEADLVLIDEARNPCILASDEFDNSFYFHRAKQFMSMVDKKDYEIMERGTIATLTNKGYDKALEFFGQELVENVNFFNAVCQSLLAYFVFRRDIDYLVRDGEVQIIDKYTGRVLEGRRFQNGLHQALEAKEDVAIKTENVAIGQITYQNLFKKFFILSGMTGTALQAKKEFSMLYGVGVAEIPTNRPMIRNDKLDILFANKQDKYARLLEIVQEKHFIGQPILIGTTSVSESEDISRIFDENKLHYQLLNAKNDMEEDLMVAKAGEKGMITISTNMAGRGTDIKLTDEVEALGGLCVIGTSRNESKRIDLQLRGRSGRQGQMGESVYLLSSEDDIFKRNKCPSFDSYFKKVKHKCPVEGKEVTQVVDTVQSNIESIHEHIRINNYKADQMVNIHRDYFFKIRKDFLFDSTDLSVFKPLIPDIVSSKLEELTPFEFLTPEEYSKFADHIYQTYGFVPGLTGNEYMIDEVKLKTIEVFEKKIDELIALDSEEDKVGIRQFTLGAFDRAWAIYLSEVDYQKQAYGLSKMGVQNPEQEFARDLDLIFKEIFKDMANEVLSFLIKAKLTKEHQKNNRIVEWQDLNLDSHANVNIEKLIEKQSINIVLEYATTVLIDKIISTKDDILQIIQEHSTDNGFYTLRAISLNEQLFSVWYVREGDKFLFN